MHVGRVKPRISWLVQQNQKADLPLPTKSTTCPLLCSSLHQSGYHTLCAFALGFLFLSLCSFWKQGMERGKNVTVVHEIHPSFESWNLFLKWDKDSNNDEFLEWRKLTTFQLSTSHSAIQLKVMNSLFPKVVPGTCVCATVDRARSHFCLHSIFRIYI